MSVVRLLIKVLTAVAGVCNSNERVKKMVALLLVSPKLCNTEKLELLAHNKRLLKHKNTSKNFSNGHSYQQNWKMEQRTSI